MRTRCGQRGSRCANAEDNEAMSGLATEPLFKAGSGFEPEQLGVKGRCAANYAIPLADWRRQGSNL